MNYSFTDQISDETLSLIILGLMSVVIIVLCLLAIRRSKANIQGYVNAKNKYNEKKFELTNKK